MKIHKLALVILVFATVSAHAAEWTASAVQVMVPGPSGAGVLIAGEYAAHAKPDGTALFMAANGPLLFRPILIADQVDFNLIKCL